MNFKISVDYGPFENITAAANSEKLIDWWDDTDKNQIFCTESFAGLEIIEHLQKSGLQLNGDRSDAGERNRSAANVRDRSELVILLGRSAIEKEGLIVPTAGRDGAYKSYFKSKQWNVLIWGEDCFGTLRASYEWLQSLGIRWYTPDEKGTYIPKHITLSEDEKIINYDYLTRGCYNEFVDDNNPDFLDWAARNGMNMLRVQHFYNPHAVKKRGLQIMSGGHDIFYKYLNPNSEYPYPIKDNENGKATYFDMHPEWFALIDGKRSARDENIKATEGYYTGDNICTSNMEGVKELAKNMLVSLNEGSYKYCDYLNLWAYDNGAWCNCKDCQKIGNLSRRMLLLAYNINKIFYNAYKKGETHRRIKLVVPIYHETLEPPDLPLPEDFDYDYIISTFFPIERCYAHNINDTGCTETNLQLNNLYKKWTDENKSNYKGDIFIGEYYNVSSFASLPFVFTSKIANDVPYYFNTGTKHFYYMHISLKNWGMLLLNNCVLAGFLKSLSFSVNDFLNELYGNYYIGTGQIMRAFHKSLEKASINMKYLKHYQFTSDGRKLSLIGEIEKAEKFPITHCKFGHVSDDYNNAISFSQTMLELEKARNQVYKAYNIAKGPEKQRIETEIMRFEYGYKVMNFIFNYVILRLAFEKNDKSKVEQTFKVTETLRDELKGITIPLEEMKYECPWYENAYKATWHDKTYEKFRNKIMKYIGRGTGLL